MRVERALAVLSMVVLLSGAPVAAAADVDEAERIARGLVENGPVHIDPAYADDVSGRTIQEIERLILESGLPIRVLAIPLGVEGEEYWQGDAERLVADVHGLIGDDGHYLFLEKNRSVGIDYVGELREPFGHAYYAVRMAEEGFYTSLSLDDRLWEMVDYAVHSDPEELYEKTRLHEQEAASPLEPSPPEPPAPVDDTSTMPRGPWIGVGAGVVGASLLAGGLLYRSRRRTLVPPSRASFDNAAHTRHEVLAERAERELVEVGERITRVRARGEVGLTFLERALERRGAARTILEGVGTEPAIEDLVGVLVLLDMAEDALARARGVRPPDALAPRHCYADPLHGTDTVETDWRGLGGNETLRVPLCPSCVESVRERRRPDSLHVEHEGGRVPYHEVPAERSLWSATGYGALADDLVERIRRGEHRTRR
ncbi:hypothetical protein [Nocardiopsis alba]|uniref:hypothetical protein n=1 Tax=Nocardiopsis alba TaxID=53437 RepID=UPI00362C9E94